MRELSPNKTVGTIQKSGAKIDIVNAKAAKVLLTNDDIGVELVVGPIKIGLCEATNKALSAILDVQIKEATKFIKGEKSKY